MRTTALAVLVFCAGVAASAGDINMNLTNPGAGSGAAPSSGKPAGPGLKPLDAALAQADAAAKDLLTSLATAENVLRTAPKEAATDYRRVYLDNLTQDCRKAFRPSDVAAAATQLGLARPVSRYLACQALASQQHSACTASPVYSTKAPANGGESPAIYCLDAYFMLKFADAKASGGDAAAVCRQADAARGGKTDVAAACAKAAAGACEPMVPLSWQPFEDFPHCGAVFSAIKGDAGACSASKKYDAMAFAYTCADVAAVRAARKGGSCGDSAACQALRTGKPEACLPLLVAARDAYCKSMVDTKAAHESDAIEAAAKEWRAKNPPARTAAMNVVVEKRRAVDVMLVAIGQAVDTYEPKTEAGFSARVTRYRELRRKVDAELRRFKLATEGPAKPKAP